MYNKKKRGFHLRGYLSLLAIKLHIFSFSRIQLCDPIRRRVECFVGISMPQLVLRIKLSLLKFE